MQKAVALVKISSVVVAVVIVVVAVIAVAAVALVVAASVAVVAGVAILPVVPVVPAAAPAAAPAVGLVAVGGEMPVVDADTRPTTWVRAAKVGQSLRHTWAASCSACCRYGLNDVNCV